MKLKQLYYFKRLSETEHYTEAASSLFITQPSLSHAIAELEKELGVSLFFRQGRNVRISESGKCFLPYVETALSALENGRERLKKITFCAGKISELGLSIQWGNMLFRKLSTITPNTFVIMM